MRTTMTFLISVFGFRLPNGRSWAMHVPEIGVETMSDKTEEKNECNSTKDTAVEPKPEETRVSKDKPSSKDNYYIKKRIIAAINRSFKSNNNSIHHTFAVNDDDKNDAKNRQSITIIVKRIDLDKESILYTQEKAIPEVINLETFKVKEISGKEDSKHNSHHSSDKKRSSDDRSHRSSDKRHSDSHRSSDGKRSEDGHRSEKKHHISDETLKRPYLLCYSCGRKEEKKWVHENCKNKCCRSTTFYCDSCLKHKIVKNDYCNDLIKGVNFGKYMYVIKCPNGRGCSLHMDYERIIHLRSSEQREVATEFLKVNSSTSITTYVELSFFFQPLVLTDVRHSDGRILWRTFGFGTEQMPCTCKSRNFFYFSKLHLRYWKKNVQRFSQSTISESFWNAFKFFSKFSIIFVQSLTKFTGDFRKISSKILSRFFLKNLPFENSDNFFLKSAKNVSKTSWNFPYRF